jgi:hypothetical protein
MNIAIRFFVFARHLPAMKAEVPLYVARGMNAGWGDANLARSA